MMSSPSTSSAKSIPMTNAKRHCEHCPECAKRNVQSRLRHYKVNLDADNLKMCENDQCLYPLMTKDLDDILVTGDFIGRKNRRKQREMADFDGFNGPHSSLYDSNRQNVKKIQTNNLSINFGPVSATRLKETDDDILRDLFVVDKTGVETNVDDIADLVNMLETVTRDVSIPVTNNETGVSKSKTRVARPKKVSTARNTTKNQINMETQSFKAAPLQDKVGVAPKRFSNHSRASLVGIQAPTIVERSKVDPRRNEIGKNDVRSKPTTVEPPKPTETQTKSRNPLMRFLMSKQKAKDSPRPVSSTKLIDTTQKTVVSRSPPKSKTKNSVSPSKSLTSVEMKDVTTSNRMVTSWLASANSGGKTTFPSYLSAANKQKDDGFVSEDSGIQSPQSLLSGESEPASVRHDAMHQVI